MKNDKLNTLESFSDSDINSAAEKEFTSTELQGFFDEKLKAKYSDKLSREFNVRKLGQTTPTKKLSLIKYVLIGAIGLLTALAIYYFSTKEVISPQNTMTAFKNELYVPIDANVRGSQTEKQKAMSQLTNAYEQKDFGKFITEYKTLKASTDINEPSIEQMAAIAYASQEDYSTAITIFTDILKTPESTYSNHKTVRYLLGLVHKLNNDNESAKAIWMEIKKGDDKYSEVQALLKTM